MSKRHSHTTADYIPWSVATNLVRRLYRDGDYRMSLLVAVGIFTGLRISDLLSLRWSQILDREELSIVEGKTGKLRHIRLNPELLAHVQDCHKAMAIVDDNQPCFANRNGQPISIQLVNRQLKVIKVKYQIRIDSLSSHSLRKTMARAIWENENARGRGESALLVLSEMLNHSSPAITRRYIGLRRQEIGQVYESLKF